MMQNRIANITTITIVKTKKFHKKYKETCIIIYRGEFMTILIVDDEQGIREVIEEYCLLENYEVI